MSALERNVTWEIVKRLWGKNPVGHSGYIQLNSV